MCQGLLRNGTPSSEAEDGYHMTKSMDSHYGIYISVLADSV